MAKKYFTIFDLMARFPDENSCWCYLSDQKWALWVIAVPNVIQQKVSKERKNITNAVKTVVTKNLPQLIPYFTK